jgi:hypothetical protein
MSNVLRLLCSKCIFDSKTHHLHACSMHDSPHLEARLNTDFLILGQARVVVEGPQLFQTVQAVAGKILASRAAGTGAASL